MGNGYIVKQLLYLLQIITVIRQLSGCPGQVFELAHIRARFKVTLTCSQGRTELNPDVPLT